MTTKTYEQEREDSVKVPSDLANRLRIKAGMITMGEKIAWGSDVELMLQAAQVLESYGQPAQPSVPGGWKEAAIAWEVCASIHRQWAEGKDALFSTRQHDFVKHANDARAMLARYGTK